MVKICDFGLARDIYKNPDYVRKGDVSQCGVSLTHLYPVIFKPQTKALGKYLHTPCKSAFCADTQPRWAVYQRALAGGSERPPSPSSVLSPIAGLVPFGQHCQNLLPREVFSPVGGLGRPPPHCPPLTPVGIPCTLYIWKEQLGLFPSNKPG